MREDEVPGSQKSETKYPNDCLHHFENVLFFRQIISPRTLYPALMKLPNYIQECYS